MGCRLGDADEECEGKCEEGEGQTCIVAETIQGVVEKNSGIVVCLFAEQSRVKQNGIGKRIILLKRNNNYYSMVATYGSVSKQN